MNKLKELISFPKYNLSLPSNNKTVYYRPMTVREEGSLLTAKQSEDNLNILKTISDIVQNCFEDFDIKKCSLLDFEYCLLKLREKSIGEIEQLQITCPYTQESIEVTIDISKTVKFKGKKQQQRINLDDGIILKIKSPSLETLFQNPNYNKSEENKFIFIANCIQQIQKDKTIISCEDLSVQEIKEFIENLTSKQFNKLVEYFDDCERLFVELNYITSDKKERQIKISGTLNIINFFFNHLTLHTYFNLLFTMKYFHNYTLDEYHSLFPWQREVLVKMITHELEKEKNNQNAVL
jgi:hypothetical protein